MRVKQTGCSRGGERERAGGEGVQTETINIKKKQKKHQLENNVVLQKNIFYQVSGRTHWAL